ncbi:hypothetical protein HK098_003572 [Nowakowskiella sp. JEL0407]|nr:hypothetical protein HK098_003572 [Nowakowskiella sp. JEL0407]
MAIYDGGEYVSQNVAKGGWEMHLINMIYSILKLNEIGQAKNDRVGEAINFLMLLDELGYEVRVGPNRVGVTWANGMILKREDIGRFVNVMTNKHSY